MAAYLSAGLAFVSPMISIIQIKQFLNNIAQKGYIFKSCHCRADTFSYSFFLPVLMQFDGGFCFSISFIGSAITQKFSWVERNGL